MNFAVLLATGLAGSAAATPLLPRYVLDAIAGHGLAPRQEPEPEPERLSAPAERPPPWNPGTLETMHKLEDWIIAGRTGRYN